MADRADGDARVEGELGVQLAGGVVVVVERDGLSELVVGCSSFVPRAEFEQHVLV